MEKDYKMPVSVDSGGNNRPTLMWMLAGIAIGLGSGLTMYFLSNQNVDRGPTLLSEKSNAAVERPKQLVEADDAQMLAENTDENSASSSELTDNRIEQTSQAMMDDAKKDENIAEFEFYGILPELDVNVPKALIIPEPGSRGSYKAPNSDPVALTHDKTIPPVAKTKAEVAAPAFENVVEAAAPVKVASAASGQYRRLQTGSYTSSKAAENKLREFKQMGMQGQVEKALVDGKTWHRVILGPTNDPSLLSKWSSMLNGMGIKPMRLR